jgi:putative hydrolase of the HAD superfamily
MSHNSYSGFPAQSRPVSSYRCDRNQSCTLLIDADDTLWENNIYFLQVERRFAELLTPFKVSADAVRAALAQAEVSNIPLHGYGSRAFAVSLGHAFRSLVHDAPGMILEELEALAGAIFARETIELLPGVKDTLPCLAENHQLILVTKGDPEEQRAKLERSGLAEYFTHVEIVPEKSVLTYRSLIIRLALHPDRTWMVGNSPRSDINPAIQAGLRAVFIPHSHTWDLEIEEITAPPERLNIVESFSDLASLFCPDAFVSGGS